MAIYISEAEWYKQVMRQAWPVKKLNQTGKDKGGSHSEGTENRSKRTAFLRQD